MKGSRRSTPQSRTLETCSAVWEELDVDDEETLDAMSASTATIAAHLSYLAAISQWLTSRGLAEEEASRYVVATFAPLGETLRRAPTELAHLATDHATPGGLNEQFLEALRAADFFGLVERSLDQIENRVRGR